MESAIAYSSQVVDQAYEYVKGDIKACHPNGAPEDEPFVSRLCHALRKAFALVRQKAESGRIDPFVHLVSTRYEPEIAHAKLHEIDRPIRVGFLALAGNPLWWGHILVALMSQGHLALDTVVFRVQGQIQYKDVDEEDKVPTHVRHRMAKEVLGNFYPLFRYTDLGSEPGNRREGADEMHRYLELNRDKRLHIFYLLGIESRERVEKYFRQHYEAAKRYNLNRNKKHQLTIGWIQRGKYGANISDVELETLSAQAKEATGYDGTISFAVVQDPHIDLGASSTQYRDAHDPAIVPSLVDENARVYGYYGYHPSKQGWADARIG
jgi:hypothetical protein